MNLRSPFPAELARRFLAVSLALALAACAATREEAEEKTRDYFETMSDTQIEAGFEDTVLARDDALLERRVIVITTAINERTAKDVISRLLVLDALDPNAPIDLYVTTQGGWLDSAFAVIDVIDSLHAPVNTIGVGGVYSAGAMIAAAGSGRRVARGNALFMVHANLPETQNEGSVEALEKQRIERFWRSRARLPESWFPLTGEDEHFLSAADAQRYGIVDEVLAPRAAADRAR